MKKFLWYTLAALLTLAAFSSCKKTPEEEKPAEPSNVVATVKASDLIDAAAAAYDAWEENTTIPTSLTVGGKSLTLPQYQYAIAKLLVNLAANDKGDIQVLGFKEADHPERDSYDKKEIAVTGGPKITEGTEDLVDIAKRMLTAMTEKLTVPNQTVITRSGASALAFSTNRSTVSILRALAEYKAKGSLPATVSTEYLSAAASLKGFAQQFVGILDIWEKTVGTVSADGSHCTDNNSAWKDVHFVPIPWSGGAYVDGVDQYDAKYQPYFTVNVDGKEYTSAETWGIALRGIMDMLTKEGSGTLQQERNKFIHTMGNGASLKEPIPAVNAFDIWGQYPWYESTNDGVPINKDAISPYIIVRTAAWFLTRQQGLEKIGNYQIYGTDDASELIEEGYTGFISSMRMWLIAARFYKYLLDNNITENVYDAVKDVTFSTDLYGVEMPDITAANNSVSLDSDGTEVTFSFNAKKAWTATASESWIHVDPASGEAGTNIVLKVTADPNTGALREGKITLKGGNVDALDIAVSQSKYIAPSAASLKEFAQEFVKGLDVWAATVGTVESESEHLIEKGTAWENVHFIPIVPNPGCEYLSHEGNQYDPKYTPWVLNVAGQEISSSQAWEIAIRGLMNMVTKEGEAFLSTMDDRNKAYTLGNNQSFSEAGMPNPSEANQWGKHPWYEGSDADRVKYNGAEIESVDVNFMVKVGAWHVVRSFIPAGSNSPLGMIGNFQQFGTGSSTLNLDGYDGLIAPMRELIVLMRIYKYILDNNIDTNVYDALKDQKFDFDMYDQGAAPVEFTLKDFAKEFVKGLDVWGETVGNIDADGYRNSQSAQGAWLNVHYIPIGNGNNSDFKDYGDNQYDDGKTPWTLNVAGTTYTSSQAWEMAIRGLLNMCTTEGEAFLDDMTDRNKAYTLGDGKNFKSAIPTPSEANKWGKNPWYEYGELVTYNGNPIEKVDVNFMLKVGAWHVVRSFIPAGSNSPLGMVGNFQQFGTGSSTLNLDGYEGLISPMRELLVLMRIYKYLLDNNIEENVYSAIKDQKFDFWLYGPNGDISAPSLKAFAKEFVKGLEVWEATVGTVESENKHLMENGTAWENVHFIPVGKTGGEYDDHAGNQHDAKYTPWTLTVSGTEFTSAQAWEIATRGLLDMVLTDGQGYIAKMTSRNKPGYTLGDNKSFSKLAIASPSKYAMWGNYPWYEEDGVTYNGAPLEEVGIDVITKATLGHLVRGLVGIPGVFEPLGKIGNFQEFGTTDSSLMLEGYSGLISPMRELILMMRVYKYMLDNGVDENVYTALKDVKFEYDMYHQGK